MNAYQIRAFEGASGVDLTVALYDGIIRFMNHAIIAVERGDVGQRRAAVKRAMDIVIHLQATLILDVGGEPAKALSEFYIAMFALMLQGSQANSQEKFEQVIACVRNVRGAWRQVANQSGAGAFPQQVSDPAVGHLQPGFEKADSGMDSSVSSSWSA